MRGRGRAAHLTDVVEGIAVTGPDDRGLREWLLGLIKGAVPFDAYAFLLTDPVTSVGCSPLAEVPNPAALPDLIRCKYLTPVNRWTELPVAGCASLHQTTGGRLDQSLLWREHLAGFGIHDVLSVVFRDRYGWWGFLDLWRRETRFTEDEVAALADARVGVRISAPGPRTGAASGLRNGYGRVQGPMGPDTSLDPCDHKGGAGARMWQDALAAHQAGRVRVVEVRASDYADAGANSHMARWRPPSSPDAPAVVAGRRARVLGSADQPHS